MCNIRNCKRCNNPPIEAREYWNELWYYKCTFCSIESKHYAFRFFAKLNWNILNN